MADVIDRDDVPAEVFGPPQGASEESLALEQGKVIFRTTTREYNSLSGKTGYLRRRGFRIRRRRGERDGVAGWYVWAEKE